MLTRLPQVRMQVKEHTSRYASSLACARALVATEGVAALYRGLGATCARNCTFNGIYFGAVWSGQQELPRPATAAGAVAQNLALGGVAGAAATLVKAPFDVVKSRIQAQLPDAAGQLCYRSTVQALLLVARSEGVAALWKGLGPMLVRCTLGFSVSLAAFDFAMSALGSSSAHIREAEGHAVPMIHED